MPYFEESWDGLRDLVYAKRLDWDCLEELHEQKKGLPHGKMTPAKREKIPKRLFVFPDEKKWPIHDLEHAKIALIWSTWPQHKKVAPKVRKVVFKRYPKLKQWFKSGKYAEERSMGKLGDDPRIAARLTNISEALKQSEKRGMKFEAQMSKKEIGTVTKIVAGVIGEASGKIAGMLADKYPRQINENGLNEVLEKELRKVAMGCVERAMETPG